MDSPLNPNFWVCLCKPPDNIRNEGFEPQCSKCKALAGQEPYANQQQVNDHAEYIQAQQAAANKIKHELPPQRKKSHGKPNRTATQTKLI